MDQPRLKNEEQFADDLRSLAGPLLMVPPSVDEQVLASARRQLALRRKRRAIWSASAAAAAVLVLSAGFLLALHLQRNDTAQPAQTTVAREDVNSDGSVDILDAFALARIIEQKGAIRPEWDFTGDGAVTEADAKYLASSVVSLSRR